MKYKERRWPLECIPDVKQAVKRIQKIEELSVDLPSIPHVTHTFTADYIIQHIEKVSSIVRYTDASSIDSMVQLAKDIDTIHDEGLVHGDINPKNLVVSNDRIYLIDWEPSLIQKRGTRTMYRCTLPWMAHYDIMNHKVTSSNLHVQLRAAYVLFLPMNIFVFEWEVDAEYYEGQLKGYLNKRNDFLDLHYKDSESTQFILDYLSDHLTMIEKSIRNSKDLNLIEQPLDWKSTFALKDGKLYLA